MLAANMPRLKARKRLDEIEANPERIGAMHPDELYDIVMTATGSEELASSYRVAAIKAKWKPR